MANHLRRNEKAIKSGFSELTSVKDALIESGLKNVLEAGMKYAIAEHDHSHFAHRISDNSYGWVIVHDGAVVSYSANLSHHGAYGNGGAYDMLMEKAREVASGGWHGILLASMEVDIKNRREPLFLEVEYEMAVLDDVLEITESNLYKFFKAV